MAKSAGGSVEIKKKKLCLKCSMPPYCYFQFSIPNLKKWYRLHHDKKITTRKLLKQARTAKQRNEVIAAALLDVNDKTIVQSLKPRSRQGKKFLECYLDCRKKVKKIIKAKKSPRGKI
jgi:hypothetical protein